MKELIFFLAFLAAQLSLFGQNISGRLTDEEGNPLSYGNIGVIGLNRGTISSVNGDFRIDISGLDNGNIIRFSYVGYESKDYNVGDLIARNLGALNVALKARTYQLKELVVRPEGEPSFIGAKKAGSMAWVWSEAINGAEIGTLFRNSDEIVVKKLFFHVRRNFCDSILYRIKIYDGSNEQPVDIINTSDIRFIAKKKRGWESVDLSEYNIAIDGDFIITLETLKAWTSGNYKATRLSVGKSIGTSSFSRSSSMAPWIEFANQMSFKVQIDKANTQ